MEELMKVLEENPKAKEEFEFLLEIRDIGSKGMIEILSNYIERLEDMIEEGKNREELLKEIDRFNHWTELMRYDGILDEKETWWEDVLKRKYLEKPMKNS